MQGCGGFTIPGGIQKQGRCYTEGHGWDGLVVGLDDLRGPFQPSWFYYSG